MTRRSNAFTLVELAIVLSIAVFLVPGIYLFLRTTERVLFETAVQLESAESARSISEELRHDLATMHWADRGQMMLNGKAPCGEVRYEVRESVAYRRADGACGGGERAIARHVESLRRTPWGGVEIVFARHTRTLEPYRVTFLFAGGEQR